MKLTWDTTDHYCNYPEIIKKEYRKNYIKYFNKFAYWIDNIAKENGSNLSWWLSTVASRDERESNLYHNICIYFTILKNKNLNLQSVVINSNALKKILIRDLKEVFIIKVKKNFLEKKKLIFKNFIFYLIQFLIIKIISVKKKIEKKTCLIGTYVINKKNYNFYGNFFSKNKKNIIFCPIFTNSSLKFFFLYILKRYKKNNYLFKESYLSFKDLFYSFFLKGKINLNINKIFFDKKIDFNSIIFEEINSNRYLRSVLQGHLNYFFFKKIRQKNLIFSKIINSFENQIPDKGWNLGINTYYPSIKNIGHQSVLYHPQFQNLYPTNSEYSFKVIPKKIFLTGQFFIKERIKFCKKINFLLTKDFKFDKIKKVKKNIQILVLFSGIKVHDQQLLSLILKNYNFFKEKKIIVYLKFHPILESRFFLKDMKNLSFIKEIKGKGSIIIQRSKIVITSSFTAGIYESLIRNCYTLLYHMHPFDYKIHKNFNYLNNFIFFDNSKNMLNILNIILNKKNHLKETNNLRINNFKSLLFSK